MNLTKTGLFYFSLIMVALMSASPYMRFGALGNTTVSYIFSFAIVLLIPYMKRRYNPDFVSKDYTIVKWYLIWMAVMGVGRGLFVADNYWEYKNLVNGTLSCLVPAFVYVFNPTVQQRFYRTWMKYCIPLFFLFFLWAITPGEVNFYLGPVFVAGCFWPYLTKKWKIMIGILLAYMLVADLGGRSQVLKAALAIGFSLLCIYRRFVSEKMLKLAHWSCYIGAIVLVVLGITGVFNIFTDMSSNEGKYVEKKVVDGQVVEDDLSADTRTFIYIEVLQSALKNDYVLCGRSLARGNDSMTFGSYNAEDLHTGRYERYGNELCHLNIFTWLGLIGMVLHSLIYLRSSWLAMYRSNSYYLKLIGVFIAVHWAYGWVEDTTKFDILNISLWSAISMGLCAQFRAMTDEEFINWFRGIFKKEKKYNQTAKI